jgi:hypothetical protein
MDTLASLGGPPASDPVSGDDDIGGGVWDGRQGMADTIVTADARGREEKGGIVKDTHLTWETSSAGS